jgi:hypothetical protein
MKIRVIENVIVCIPFVSILLYKSLLIEASILFTCSLIFALFSFYSTYNLTIPTPFSKRPFEFSVGFRKTFFAILIAYVLTIIAVYVDNLNLGIFSFLFVFLISLSYYQKPEEEYYVWIHAESPKTFIKNKLVHASINISGLTAPILISLIIVNPLELKWILLFFLIGHLFLWTVILAKYSAFPGEMNLPEGMMLAFSISFPPLLLVLLPYFYSKSITKLRYLLND